MLKDKKIILIMFILIFFSLSAVSAEDNVFLTSNVDNTIYVNNSYTGDLEDGSINHPYKSLYSGVSNLNDECESIYIANGVYVLDEPLVFANRTLSITGESREVILDANGKGNVFAFFDGNYTVSSLTMVNGTGYDKNDLDFGGAIFAMTNNATTKVYNSGSESVFVYNTLYVYDCAFISSVANIGGAICGLESNIFIYSSLFEDNTADSGGAVRVNNSHLIIDDSVFRGGFAREGGAIYAEGSLTSIENSLFESNGGNSTGAIYVNQGILDLNNSIIKDNYARGNYTYGGAITIIDTLTEISNSLITNNTVNATYVATGGAIVNNNRLGLNIVNTTIVNNFANSLIAIGSAISNKGFLILNNSVITENILNSSYYIEDAIYNVNGIVTNIDSVIGNNTSIGIIDDESRDVPLVLYSPFVVGTIDYENITLPEKYDLRNVTLANGSTVSYVTPVKNQGNFGTCWAFTSIAALESHLLLTEGVSYNFSEINLRNLISNTSAWGYDTDGDGGDFYYAGAYFSRWSGPVNETDDPYIINSTVSPENLTVIKHVQDMVFIPLRTDFTDLNQVKIAILKYGGVGIMFDATDYEMMDIDNNISMPNFYEPIPSNINHAVILVGWDDNYSASNFNSRYGKPEGDGAFIIKNSWGDTKGDSGYYYVSYYDATFGGGEALAFAITNVEEVDNYKDMYLYDPLGTTLTFIGYNNETAWFRNSFVSQGDDPLAAFSLISSSPQSEYEAYIYVNEELVSEIKDTINEPGYHTIKLNPYITLKEGDTFDIIVKLTTPGFYTPIAVQTLTDSTSNAHAESGHSYISGDGETWFDVAGEIESIQHDGSLIYLNILNQTSVCLKAFTAYTNETEITCNEYNGIVLNPENLTGKLIDNEGNGIANQKVEILLTRLDTGLSKTYYVKTDEDGNYQLPINLAANKYTAKASFNGYNTLKYSDSNITSITVKKDNKTTTILNGETYNEKYSGVGVYNKNFKGTLKLEDGTPLTNQIVSISLTRLSSGASKTYAVNTDANGEYNLPISLAIGQYQALCSYSGTTLYSSDETLTSLTINP